MIEISINQCELNYLMMYVLQRPPKNELNIFPSAEPQTINMSNLSSVSHTSGGECTLVVV